MFAGCVRSPQPLEYHTLATEIIALRKERHIVCTGFWVGAKHAVTAKHCLNSFDSVTDYYGRRVAVIRVYPDPTTDIGLLVLDPKQPHNSAILSAKVPRPGHQVWSIGHQMGQGWWYSTGLASGIRDGLFSFTAPIMPGASGSPVYTETGTVCGVAVAVQQYPVQLIPGLFALTPVPHMAYAVPSKKVLQFLRRSLP